MKSNDSISTESLIVKELGIVQSEIARFDNNGLTIRSWCLASWTAIIAYGIQNQNPLIVWASLVTTLSFALIDLMHRRIQVRFILRSKEIEERLNNRDFAGYYYAVHRTATGKENDSRFRVEVLSILGHPYYWLFYFILLVFAAVCVFFVIHFGR